MDTYAEETYVVPRIGVSISKPEFRRIFLSVIQNMGYDRLTDDQRKAVEAFVLGKDVFVSLPTGSGKSLCYACLPHVFDELRSQRAGGTLDHLSIVVVVSPLNSLMQDQVHRYNTKLYGCVLLTTGYCFISLNYTSGEEVRG